LDALLGRIERIQGDIIAENILATPNPLPTAIDNTVLGYLRSFNKNYVAATINFGMWSPNGIMKVIFTNN